MLLLNDMNYVILQILSDFNTSYVVIKHRKTGITATARTDFNTSYVVIKQLYFVDGTEVQGFQYILCCY